jgi:hypothetical protein
MPPCRDYGARKLPALGVRNPTRWNPNISNNVAKLPVEYSISMPREPLRPGYGEGCAGAPVTLQAAPRGAGKREKWLRKDQRKRDRKSAGLDTFTFRLGNG